MKPELEAFLKASLAVVEGTKERLCSNNETLLSDYEMRRSDDDDDYCDDEDFRKAKKETKRISALEDYEKISQEMEKWLQVIKPFHVANNNSYEGSQRKKQHETLYTLVIHPHRNARFDPYDYGRSSVVRIGAPFKYETYKGMDSRARTTIFRASRLEDLLPPKECDLLKYFICWEIIEPEMYSCIRTALELYTKKQVSK
jgi:hypothetical protein